MMCLSCSGPSSANEYGDKRNGARDAKVVTREKQCRGNKRVRTWNKMMPWAYQYKDCGGPAVQRSASGG